VETASGSTLAIKHMYFTLRSQIVEGHYCPANELSATGKFFQHRELITI
jgi:hypothetical protein